MGYKGVWGSFGRGLGAASDESGEDLISRQTGTAGVPEGSLRVLLGLFGAPWHVSRGWGAAEARPHHLPASRPWRFDSAQLPESTLHFPGHVQAAAAKVEPVWHGGWEAGWPVRRALWQAEQNLSLVYARFEHVFALRVVTGACE